MNYIACVYPHIDPGQVYFNSFVVIILGNSVRGVRKD